MQISYWSSIFSFAGLVFRAGRQILFDSVYFNTSLGAYSLLEDNFFLFLKSI